MKNLILGGLTAALMISMTASAYPADVRIVALGDSNFDVPNLAESDAYPAQLERLLRAKGINASVTNAGQRGELSDQTLARTDSAVPDGTTLVLLSVGVNDVVLAHRSKTDVKRNVQAIMDRLHARHIPVLWMGTGLEFQGRYSRMPEYHVEGAQRPGATGAEPGKTNWHLNAAGSMAVAQDTLPKVLAALKQASK